VGDADFWVWVLHTLFSKYKWRWPHNGQKIYEETRKAKMVAGTISQGYYQKHQFVQ
jgi:hypothetical protein